MSNTTRLTIECSPELVRTARVLAALRGVSMRELITGMIEDAAKGQPMPPTGGTPPVSAPQQPVNVESNKALEAAVVAHLEQQIERGNAEHQRRVAAGIVKG